MTTLREAAQMALEALDSDNPDIQLRTATHLRAALAQPEPVLVSPKEFIAAVTGKWDIQGIPMLVSEWPTREEPLAQPEQEPPCKTGSQCVGNKCERCAVQEREWQGLTDEEYESMAENHVTDYFFDTLKYAHAIEAKLKEKNT
jgi:hypothetical protein